LLRASFFWAWPQDLNSFWMSAHKDGFFPPLTSRIFLRDLRERYRIDPATFIKLRKSTRKKVMYSRNPDLTLETQKEYAGQMTIGRMATREKEERGLLRKYKSSQTQGPRSAPSGARNENAMFPLQCETYPSARYASPYGDVNPANSPQFFSSPLDLSSILAKLLATPRLPFP